jgi:hypothetical protein
MTLHAADELPSRQTTEWCRFDAYSIAGKHIVPAPSAPLRVYDPWLPYWATEAHRRTVHPPYVSLLELARNLRVNRQFISDKDSEPLITTFAAECGLLGILPATVEMITFPAVADDSDDPTTWRAKTYVRRLGEWASIDRIITGDLISRGSDAIAGHGTALIWRGREHKYVFEGLERAVLSYFPTVAEAGSAVTNRVPLPGTPSFWSRYAEPLKAFCRWTVRFREAVDLVSRFSNSMGPQDRDTGADSIDADSVNEALVFLEGLASSIGRPGRFLLAKRRIQRELVSPSLLASFSEMFLRDLEKGRSAFRCAMCDQYFVSDEIRAQYCTPRCRNTMQRRRQRQRSL